METTYKELVADMIEKSYQLGQKHGKNDILKQIWDMLNESKEEKINIQNLREFISILINN